MRFIKFSPNQDSWKIHTPQPECVLPRMERSKVSSLPYWQTVVSTTSLFLTGFKWINMAFWPMAIGPKEPVVRQAKKVLRHRSWTSVSMYIACLLTTIRWWSSWTIRSRSRLLGYLLLFWTRWYSTLMVICSTAWKFWWWCIKSKFRPFELDKHPAQSTHMNPH